VNINATLFVQMVTFIALIWFVNRFLWGPLSKLMEARQKKISDGLSAAEKGKYELEQAEQRVKEALKEAKVQAKVILSQAEKRGSEIVEDAKIKATEEAGRVKVFAQAEIEQEVSRAREELRKEVSTLVVSGAEKILSKEVDAKVHGDMLQALAKSI